MSNLSQFFGGGSKFQIFTSSGTWVCPAANTKVHVLCIGGGGRGGLVGEGTTIAGTSSFGVLVTATGGVSGAPASGVTGGRGGSGYCSGKSGTDSITTYQIGAGGEGGKGAFGFGSGGHGAEPTTTSVGGSGGGGSGNIETYSGTVSTNQTVTVGAGTTSVASRSTSGSNGAVLVWWE